MFKKMLIGVILLILIAGVAACGGAQVAPMPTPNGQNSTAAEKPTKTYQKPIPVQEFIERALNGEYNEGDVVSISGIAREVYLHTKEEVSATSAAVHNTIFLRERTSDDFEYVVRILSKSVNELNKNDDGYESFMSMMKVKVGDKITVKGIYGYRNDEIIKVKREIVVIEATVQ